MTGFSPDTPGVFSAACEGNDSDLRRFLHDMLENDLLCTESHGLHVRESAVPMAQQCAAMRRLAPHTSKIEDGDTLENMESGSSSGSSGSSNSSSGSSGSSSRSFRKARSCFPIWVRKELKDWVHDHWQHPYPDADEKIEMCTKYNASAQQINIW